MEQTLMLPLLDLTVAEPQELRHAARSVGSFLVRHPLFSEAPCGKALADAASFFAIPAEAKQALAIERSLHFRGYSEMRNERDWREQIHFSRDEDPSGALPYERLRGPNLWPGDPAWVARQIKLMSDFETVGREILEALAPGSFAEGEQPYWLMKMIHYPAAPEGRTQVSGVAPHVDFSWITLLLQDNAGGLEMLTPGGQWLEARPIPGTLAVNIGEILQFASGGEYQATPHRVTKRAGMPSRISLPFFLNPSLDRVIRQNRATHAAAGTEVHVHRVLSGSERGAIHFGEAEWRRKGLGVWCAQCVAKPS